MPLHRWLLEFGQCSSNHIAQVLQSRNLHNFSYAPLYQYAIFPSPFRVQVDWFTSKCYLELWLFATAIYSVRDTAHTLAASGSPVDSFQLHGFDLARVDLVMALLAYY